MSTHARVCLSAWLGRVRNHAFVHPPMQILIQLTPNNNKIRSFSEDEDALELECDIRVEQHMTGAPLTSKHQVLYLSYTCPCL